MAEYIKPGPGEVPGNSGGASRARKLTGKPGFSLDAKYLQEDGIIVLSGTQALVRLPLDQHRADKARGLNTATFISGYRGSPLGGLDMLLHEQEELIKRHHVRFVPGINEDLGATAVFGSQLANLLPNPIYDGVLGVWYGKSPGVDRSGDAFKHANFAGVGKYGGVLALAGDDPNAKSSTLPSATEYQLYDAMMPVIYPGNVQELLDLGRYGFELSRYCGLWVGFKVVTNVADEFSTVEVGRNRVSIVDPGFMYKGKPWQAQQYPQLLTPYSLTTEREMMEGKLEAARLFGAANQLNNVVVRSSDDWIGLVAAGKTYFDLRQALKELGLDDDALRHYGIRILKLSLITPIDSAIIRDFAEGLEEIVVIEEKRAFIEHMVRDVLYNLSVRPRVVGKHDELGRPLVKPFGEIDSDNLGGLLYGRLIQRIPFEALTDRTAQIAKQPFPMTVPLLARTPYYCSGCPHNTSTLTVPKDAVVAAGIGCHTMTLLMDRAKGSIFGLTQMGGEGAQWVGASPFTETSHIFQNLGDGTLFHSGTLAIRQAVAANAHLTYKILWNSAVAMTGGQDPDVQMSVWQLTHLLRAEGVGKIIVTTTDPDAYPSNASWADGVEVWNRDRIEEAQVQLVKHPGVTALIHDQYCAAELRRKRRRGILPEPATRVFINEAVCEGCGDCGEKSNCLSVFPVETEFGRKTQIHQSSCNKDYSCLKGDCPAFITVEPVETELRRSKPIYEVDVDLPEPVMRVRGESNLYMMGIGGTGVVTVNQILGTAAMIDNKVVIALDQTGLSQKGGPVVGHLKILDGPDEVANRISRGAANGYLVFDLLTGTTYQNLIQATPGQTIAVVSSSVVPTGQMVASTGVQFPRMNSLHDAIDEFTTPESNVYFDAIALSEALFGSHMPANLMLIGAAYQLGLIPISSEAIEQAIQLNGVAVKANTQAFRVGRRIVIEPAWVQTLETKRQGQIDKKPVVSSEARAIINTVRAGGEILRLLEFRIPELIEYQNADYAKAYAAFVAKVFEAEQAAVPGRTALTEGVARHLFKLMAYKDEYEVARLSLKSELKSELAEQFGPSAKVSYMLHPPMLRSMGMNRKLKLGSWFNFGLMALKRAKFLRGTRFDIFGYARVRRVERTLIQEYRQMIEGTLATLAPEKHDMAVELASLPDIIRGYEDVKLRNVEKFRSQVKQIAGK